MAGSDDPADCIDCEAGKYNPMAGSDDPADCIDCEAGKYSFAAGASTCEEDPAGFLCYVDASRIYYVDASL